MHFLKTAGIAGAVATTLLAAPAFADVNVYTTREPGLIKPLLDAFTAKTGIAVNAVFVEKGLPEKVQAEGENSPADILMTVDFGNLIDLVDAGVTQPVSDPVLEAAIPANLRDPAGNWFALSLRARVIYAAKDSDIETFTYEQLADPAYKGKVCIRSGQHPYNTALFSAMLVKHGEAKLTEYLTALKTNLARRPAGGGIRPFLRRARSRAGRPPGCGPRVSSRGGPPRVRSSSTPP